jgi:hypothetical protein
MVQIDVPIAFATGLYLTDVAHRQLRSGGPEYYYRSFFVLLIFNIFFFGWIPVYFLMNYFSWEVTHMWWSASSVDAYPFFVPIFLVVFFGAAMLGFLLGHHLVVTERRGLNRAIWLGVLVFSAIWVLGQTNRTFRVGTREEWLAGTSPLFYEDRTFLLMLIFTTLVWVVGIVWATTLLKRDGEHLDVIGSAAPLPQAGRA